MPAGDVCLGSSAAGAAFIVVGGGPLVRRFELVAGARRIGRWFVGCGCIAAFMLAVGARAAESAARPVEPVRVLLQLSLTVDGKLRDGAASLMLYTARLDAPELPRPLRPQALPGPAGAAGWVRIEMAPGAHFLLVLPPGMDQNPPAVAYHAPSARYGRLLRYGADSLRGASWQPETGGFVYAGAAPDHFRALEGFLLRVPGDAASVYAGSVAVTCSNGAGLFGTLIRACSEVSVADHRGEIPALALDTPMPASLITPYGMPLEAVDLRGDGVIAGVVHPAAAVTATSRGAMPGRAPPLAIGPGPAVGVFNLLMLAGKLAADAAGSRDAAARAQAWQPCLEDLAAESAPAADENAIVDAVERARQSAWTSDRDRGPLPAAAPGETGFHLGIELTPQRLEMVPCRDADHACLEMAMRVSVVDLIRQRLLFDAVLVRGDSVAGANPRLAARRLLELPADQRPAAKSMAQWCGADRVAQFRAEIGQASEAIVRSALRRMQGPW